ncbi:glycosyltransferase [Chroococcidiopsis thermalis]|nr:glycosyltransferase [Chroococcidiopsis thermalis]
MSKHILLSTDDPGIGGVAQYNRAIICGLAALGYRVTVQITTDKNSIANFEKLGFQNLWLDNENIKDIPCHLAELNLLDKPDIILCSNSCLLSNMVVKQTAIEWGIPYIIVENFVEPYLAERYPTSLDILGHHYMHARAVVAVSENDLSLLHKFFRLPKDKGNVIYYGRPSKYFTPRDLHVRERLRREFGIPQDAVVCFTAGRLEVRKGYHYLLEAIEQLKRNPGWERLYFVWAGGGIEAEFETQLKDTVEQLEIADKVKFLGQISNVLDWLNTSDIFVLPSLLEAFGISIAEAMAKGLPAIASAVGGIPEVLGNTGKLLPDPKISSHATVRDLVKAIRAWSLNPELRYSIGEACRQRAYEMFREERMIEETVAIIENTLLPNGNCEKFVQSSIVVDGIFFQLYKTGIARVWRSLLEEWAEDGFAKHIVVLDRALTAPKIPGIRYRTVPAYDYGNTDTDREMLQQICDEEGADLFISTYYTTPISTPSVFMVYDMIPEVMGWDLNHPMWREKQYAIQHASAYMAISANTAHDLATCFPQIDSQSVTVALCGVQKSFTPASKGEIDRFTNKYGISKPYFLVVGGGAGYKNSLLFFKAFAKLSSKQGFDIVCTGSNSLSEMEFREYTAGSTVHVLQLSDEELSVAYSGAIALVYPSKYEGFGLPVLEAIACGCPVITCANGAIPEVAGESALYVNDEDVDGLANALCDVQKPSIRNSLIAAGFQQAQKFSWSKMAATVSSALVNATLLALNLKEINLIIFPDWSQSEEILCNELEQVIRAIATHSDSSQMTLLVYRGDMNEENAALMLSSVSMNLLMAEDLDVSEGAEISLVGQLGEIQWKALLPQIQARIVLDNEDKEAIAKLPLEKLPQINTESIHLSLM